MAELYEWGLIGREDLSIGSAVTTTILPDGSIGTLTQLGLHTWVDGVRNVLQAGAVGDGTTDERTALNTLANTTMQPTGGVIYFPPRQFRLSSSMTFPANVTLWLAPGALIMPGSGVTATVNGSLWASMDNHFGSGVGDVAFGTKVSEFWPEWWGAVGDGVTDSGVAFQKLVSSVNLSGGGKVIRLSAAAYIFGNVPDTGTIRLTTSGNSIIGEGIGVSRLIFTSTVTSPAPIFIPPVGAALNGFTMRGFTMRDTSITTKTGTAFGAGVEIYSVNKVLIEKCEFLGVKGNASIVVSGDFGTQLSDVRILDNLIDVSTSSGAPDGDGIKCTKMGNAFIMRNRIAGVNRFSIEGGGDTNNLTIANNVIDDTRGGSLGGSIGNFAGSNISIVDNKMFSSKTGLEKLINLNGTAVINNLIIARNTIECGCVGIHLGGTPINGLLILDNIIRSPHAIIQGGSAASGIWRFSGNTLYGGSAQRFMVECSANGTVTAGAWLIFENNTLLSTFAGSQVFFVVGYANVNDVGSPFWSGANIRNLIFSNNHLGNSFDSLQNSQMDGHTAAISPAAGAGAISLIQSASLSGALPGDLVSFIDATGVLPNGITAHGRVSSADTITWWLHNGTTTAHGGGGNMRIQAKRNIDL